MCMPLSDDKIPLGKAANHKYMGQRINFAQPVSDVFTQDMVGGAFSIFGLDHCFLSRVYRGDFLQPITLNPHLG